jgi:6-phosphogluconate dehydrogenase-like protein
MALAIAMAFRPALAALRRSAVTSRPAAKRVFNHERDPIPYCLSWHRSDGVAQVRNILKEGFALTAWNRSAAKADALVQFGDGVAATPADAVRTADVVILMLENCGIVERVLFGSGMVEAMRPGTIVVDMNSIKPA